MTTTPHRPAPSAPGITSLVAPGQGAGAVPGGVPASRPASQHPPQRRPGPVKGLVRPGAGLAAVAVSQLLFASVLAALAPAQEDPVAQDYWGFWRARADMLEAIARDALGDPDAADAALERALDLSQPSGDLTPFLYPAADLLERQARHRTGHAAMVAEIRGLLAGTQAGPRYGALPPSRPEPLLEPLSGSEIRVLRYLPTNLTGPEIAADLYVSHNTVRTHLRHLYAKLGTHRRADTVARALALGLLAPSPHRGQATRAG
jgi:LuxR family transcriptional regulator, maltose regulon positive regulatory protein